LRIISNVYCQAVACGHVHEPEIDHVPYDFRIGTVVVPSLLHVYGKLGVTINGAVTAPVVNVDAGSVLTVNGALIVPNYAINLNLGSWILLSGLLHTSLQIPEGADLGTIGPNAEIVGNVINFGLVNVSTSNSLTIYIGNYTQSHNASLQATLGDENHAALIVSNGSISLSNSSIRYSITNKPLLKSVNFLVATANETIVGTFSADASPLPGSQISRNLGVKYTEKAIYVEYDFNVADVEIWMWVVLGVAITVIIIGTVALIVKCRKRTQYERVR